MNLRSTMPPMASKRRLGWRLRAWIWWQDVCDWCARWIFAQHNARVIIDFENRMVAVIAEVTGGMMSKPYYTKEAMLAEIGGASSRAYDDAYADGRSDVLAELGVPDPVEQDASGSNS